MRGSETKRDTKRDKRTTKRHTERGVLERALLERLRTLEQKMLTLYGPLKPLPKRSADVMISPLANRNIDGDPIKIYEYVFMQKRDSR